jgi:seryl-tRNA synthetase
LPTTILANDKQWRQTQGNLEALRSHRNEVSAQIPKLKKAGQDVARAKSKQGPVSLATGARA